MVLYSTEVINFMCEWDKIINKFKNSGHDLSKILLKCEEGEQDESKRLSTSNKKTR